jgi:hypothetical protein
VCLCCPVCFSAYSDTRFAAPLDEGSLEMADKWADEAIGSLLSRVYQGFGAIQLMVYNISTTDDRQHCLLRSMIIIEVMLLPVGS